MSVDAEDFLVFETYRDAGGHAFAKGIVSADDKDRYDAIFRHLKESVAGAIAGSTAPEELKELELPVRPRWRDPGTAPGRPVGIDHQSGLRRFLPISADLRDRLRRRHRARLLGDDPRRRLLQRRTQAPQPLDHPARERQAAPPGQSGRRQYPAGPLIGNRMEVRRKGAAGSRLLLQDPSGADHPPEGGPGLPEGWGSVYRILDFEEIAESDDRLENELSHALALFRPIMQLLQPTASEAQLARNMAELADLAEALPAFDPDDDEDGRRRILREIAVRQGQARFRDELLQAYGRRCVISGCTQVQVLQAAHISPWNGTKSNHVANGLPLRADIHTLFDLGLVRVDPATRTVSVSESLKGSEYEQYAGIVVPDPERAAHRPSQSALAKKLALFPAGD